MMEFIVDNIEISPYSLFDQDEERILREHIEKKYSIDCTVKSIVRKSLDARKKNHIVYNFRVRIETPNDDKSLLSFSEVSGSDLMSEKKEFHQSTMHPNRKVIVVGTGPAGLFCALRLIDSGLSVTLIDRGKRVEERDDDIESLKSKGLMNPESNVLFGEGGAGTYSDGKLTTRIHRGPIEYFYNRMVEFGAPSSIRYDSKPHVGTDVLKTVIVNARNEITRKGSVIVFNEKMERLLIKDNSIYGIVGSSTTEYLADAVVLAIGHSARDSYAMLANEQVALEAKGFSVGVRVEHSADFINRIQYGKYAPVLPAADYRLAYNDPVTRRGVYSFCMCPGGEVINSSSEAGHLCVNGMSYSKRDFRFSNSAIVVSVNKDDFGNQPLNGIEFQRSLESKAFVRGGEMLSAPVQTIDDFISGRISRSSIESSYKPFTQNAEISSIFPEWIRAPLVRGFQDFDRKIRGFIDHGICIGVETRTSSPLRILRNASFESVSHRNLYPIGEGAGYAGGIVSSAIDGIQCADMLLNRFQNM